MSDSYNATFFRPRVGSRYAAGWLQARILVVGACHICSLPCPHHDKCSRVEGVREMDCLCPCYAEQTDRQYYRLSNSNEIEIQSFIDGEAHYPAYKIFTYYLLKKAGDLTAADRRELWDSVAFTNLLQFFHDSSDQLPADSSLYLAAYPALLEVIERLQPQLIFAWDSRVKDALRQAGSNELRYLGRANMQFGLELYIFNLKKNGIKGKQLTHLRRHFDVKNEVHQLGWYTNLLKKHLKSCILEEDEVDRVINRIANIFMNLVGDHALGATDSNLYFAESERGKWTSRLKGVFLRTLKEEFPILGQGVNTAIETIFDEKIATNRRDPGELKPSEVRIYDNFKSLLKQEKPWDRKGVSKK